MLIKEYRIPVPMTVDEYRIAQLYMIVKKSREETNSSGSGVEIIKNEPYTNGPGGNGQYTFKIYHIERHLPGWFKAILPANAMKIEEEAWNAYPYTKTRYRCPFIDRFLLEVETCYQTDFGTQENIFKLKPQEIEQRVVEFLDIVQSQPLADIPTENPAIFRSEKTGRGPLPPDWFEQIKKTDRKESIMCAYKLCRAEFRYWGMQSRCERFIHEIALRKTILRAHRQAWCWQDEYQGLTLADIRCLEDETQRELNKRMAQFQNENIRLSLKLENYENENLLKNSTNSINENKQSLKIKRSRQMSIDNINANRPRINSFPVPPLPRDETPDDEFFDAESIIEGVSNLRSSRNLIHSIEDICLNDSIHSGSHQSSIDDDERIFGMSSSDDNNNKCTIEILILIFYGGNIFSTEDAFVSAKKTDFLSFRSTFDNVIRNHYPHVEGKIAIRFVECRSICIEALNLLNNLSPYGALNMTYDISHSETLPINAIPLFAISNPGYQTTLTNAITSANKVYQEFISSKEGKYFSGQVVIIGDANGALLAYDALCLNHSLEDATSLYGDESSTPRTPAFSKRIGKDSNNDTCSGQSSNRLNTKNTLTNDNFETNDNYDSLRTRQENSTVTLAFDVNEFFSFGSPLSLILAFRRMVTDSVVRPYCGQLYNLFHACDPNACRIEPLIQSEFSQIPPCCIPRYSQFPLGDGESTLLIEYIHQYSNLFLNNNNNNNNNTNQLSNETNTLFSDLRQTWWGSRRVDYIVYCPEFLMSQPAHVLPIVFHSSYWESRDVMSFILRNITRNQEQFHLFNSHTNVNSYSFAPMKPTERWLHRTTGVKIRNLAPNHRGNDTMVVDARPQTIYAKFHYGPIDMVCLANEKVDIYVMRSAPYGEWTLFDTVETDTHGRIRYTIADDKKLPLGLHPVKLVVRGDHTTVDLYLTVLPPKSEAVIFSIDGSFTSSFSVSHHDPKVRPGAVDVVRYWQELGYIIIYVTARPDIQQRQVVHWLAQHNFPHGMTLFNDGIYREPIKHKAEMLRNVVENADLIITAAYGSTKDIPGYQLIHVSPEKIFVVGKVKNRLQGQARFLTNGYALHLTELSKPGMVRPSKSNSRHLIRRACFNLPKLSIITTAQSSTSLINTKQSSSPTSQHPIIDQTLSAPLIHRKINLYDDTNDSQHHHRLILSTSQSKEASSRGISPRINRNKTPTKLFVEAHLAKHKAYCPYSNFRVGAAILTSTGKIYSGCNIENASYALATCAERTALVKAVSEGEHSFEKIAITSDVESSFTGPCGSCRQTLAEFGLDLDVYLVNPKNESKHFKLRELLPLAFTPRDLQKSRTSHDIIE
ncbi:unnamed protein product [Rotaria sp. Silwood1]|nr:unnamed protein product [Rotaria sp. Silwood1]CAF4613325.1 unnamed protein product [Rotaria sp. Silwood1]